MTLSLAILGWLLAGFTWSHSILNLTTVIAFVAGLQAAIRAASADQIERPWSIWVALYALIFAGSLASPGYKDMSAILWAMALSWPVIWSGYKILRGLRNEPRQDDE
ncbi:MAG: hypothetical protein JNK56_17850 [Myxococcales bacterium]|nr:hypothetical protein [Myxococcales bacterium]